VDVRKALESAVRRSPRAYVASYGVDISEGRHIYFRMLDKRKSINLSPPHTESEWFKQS
jgi:hypothetical protein